MGWRQRLAELVLAGGTMVASACSSDGGVAPCNANPDPCCLMPNSATCKALAACIGDGGFATVNGPGVTCTFPSRQDARIDAP
jgi:hypothetical protein